MLLIVVLAVLNLDVILIVIAAATLRGMPDARGRSVARGSGPSPPRSGATSTSTGSGLLTRSRGRLAARRQLPSDGSTAWVAYCRAVPAAPAPALGLRPIRQALTVVVLTGLLPRASKDARATVLGCGQHLGFAITLALKGHIARVRRRRLTLRRADTSGGTALTLDLLLLALALSLLIRLVARALLASAPPRGRDSIDPARHLRVLVQVVLASAAVAAPTAATTGLGL